MNNLNDPPELNIRPDERGDGGSNKWNYALIVPLLGLAAFRWIWDTYKRKIQQIKEDERHRVQQETEAMDLLKDIKQDLMERQHIYCSKFSRKSRRLEMEKKLLDKVAKKPLAQELNIEDNLKDIFRNDRHCACFGNRDKRNNGSLMWVYLKNWEQYVKQQTEQKRVECSMGAAPPDQDPAGSRTRT
nr:coiled-coil domain-containing protein 127-like [Paramormyrops kingsleyae]XP_023666998.1 coiled-coil domain-containing protein 127-like [Paramormyrops kingsleyae]